VILLIHGLEFDKPYFQSLIKFLDEEKKQSKVILPADTDIFNAFNYCPFDQTKVVIIGQGKHHQVESFAIRFADFYTFRFRSLPRAWTGTRAIVFCTIWDCGTTKSAKHIQRARE